MKQLFSFSLLFYLLTFLLDTIFPGFISNNFSLNWILLLVLLLGTITVFLPDTPTDNRTSLFDYACTITLSVVGALIIYWKINLPNQIFHLLLSGIIGIVILVLGLIPLSLTDPTETSTPNFLKYLFTSKIKLPVSFIFVFIFVTGLIIANHPFVLPLVTKVESTSTVQSIIESELTPTVTVAPAIDPQLNIIVYNAGAPKGEAKRIADLLKNIGYQSVVAKDSSQKISNLTLEFNADQSPQADLIEEALNGEYYTINRAPLSTDSAQINIFLGSQLQPQNDQNISPNEDLNFLIH